LGQGAAHHVGGRGRVADCRFEVGKTPRIRAVPRSQELAARSEVLGEQRSDLKPWRHPPNFTGDTRSPPKTCFARVSDVLHLH
jgi:hypothetical protein